MDEKDRRVKRTQRILMETLIAVALEKGYDAVTIKDITDHADISYSTFFRHYRDKDELLIKILESSIKTLTDLMKENSGATGDAEGRILFQHISENHRFYRVLFGSQNASHILRPIQDIIQKEFVYPVGTDNLIPIDILSNHIAVSVFGLVKWWLDHDMPYPVERMATIYEELIMKPIAPLISKPLAEG